MLLLLLFSYSVTSDSLPPHGLQHARLPCPSASPGVCSNTCPLSRWCHLTVSSSVVPFSSCFQSFSASGCFLMSWVFTSCGQSIKALTSASVLPVNIQDWFPLGWTGWISLQFKGPNDINNNNCSSHGQIFCLSLLTSALTEYYKTSLRNHISHKKLQV